MVTTSPDSIWTPDGTDDYDFTVDAGATAVTIQNALLTRVRHYEATTFSGLPTTGVVGKASGYTSTDQREWRYTGTKWILVGGKMPYANVRLNADTTISTTYVGLNTQSSGIAVAGNFTVPAGCGGAYDFTMNLSVAAEAANVYCQPYINGNATGREVLSGGQRHLSNSGMFELNAGDVVQFRARVFAGTHSLTAANTWFSLGYRSAN